MIRVAKLVQHKSFNYTNIDYDFSLLQLVKPLVFGATVSAIKLPEMNDKVADGALLQISGWGSTQSLSESRTFLRAALVPCVNQEKCQKAYEKFGGLTPRMLCAGFENGGTINIFY